MIAIITGLLIFIVADSNSNKSKEKVNSVKASTNSYEITNSSSSILHSSNEITMSSSVNNTEDNYASKAIKKLSVEQRAALIILEAPEGWFFNGYPSQSTMNEFCKIDG